jgi:hypothetical protein
MVVEFYGAELHFVFLVNRRKLLQTLKALQSRDTIFGDCLSAGPRLWADGLIVWPKPIAH